MLPELEKFILMIEPGSDLITIQKSYVPKELYPPIVNFHSDNLRGLKDKERRFLLSVVRDLLVETAKVLNEVGYE